ncbi:MAG: response regulator [Gracilibacteraceae bacterium]|nr:response regulator [Gracilibacteraceae bacterium]
MTIRIRVFLVIAAVVLLITAANMIMGLVFTQPHLLEAIENDMFEVAGIADKLITSEINLLKANTAAAAHELTGLSGEELRAGLREQVEKNELFLSLTVFDIDGVMAAYGEMLTPSSLVQSREAKRAFAGESVISPVRLTQTTRRSAKTAQPVFQVYVPLGGRILSATIPGTIFNDIMEDFTIWETGSIFILDSEGTMVGNSSFNSREDGEVRIELAAISQKYERMGEFLRQMTQGGRGVGRYDYHGLERLAVYTPITGSKVGWTLGVSAPLEESPAAQVQRGLQISAVIFLVMGLLTAAYLSGLLAKPFQRVEEQNLHLAELTEVAQSASEAKSRFLANMSHEMRTPLNAVVGLSELMLGAEEGQGEAGEDLGKIHNAGMTLLGIVNDILDISKIESGKFELMPVEYDLPSLINDTVTLNIMRIGDKPVTFDLKIDETLPACLYGDELRVKQICNNLLSNAFKYTKEGTVAWSLTCEREGDDMWLTIRVADSGIGIKPEDLRQLFSEYNQVDTRSNRLIEGTGLGLAITKMMAEMMDGEVKAESEYGKGSVFTARLRQKYVNDVTIGREAAKNLRNFRYCDSKRLNNAKLNRTPMPYAKVLVVDDVRTNLDVARGMMKPYGMRVDCVTSGREAVQAIEEGKIRYNAVFMDHMMPGMDGLEATRLIRAIGTEYARNVPIIALTANAVIGNEQMFLDNGFQAFISKPIDIVRLDAVMRRWVRDKTMENPAAGAGETASPGDAAGAAETVSAEAAALEALAGVAGLDPRARAERFGGDGDVYVQVLRSYAANTGPLLAQIRSVAPEGLADYAVTVHGIKGSSRGVGAVVVGDMAAELEQAAKAGDIDLVRRRNGEFLTAAETLLDALDAALGDGARNKPRKEAPDGDLLALLTERCAEYDMDGIDEVMAKLDEFTYEKEADLIAWLREKIDQMEFAAVSARLGAA